MPTPSAARLRTMRKRRVALGRREGGGRLVHDEDAGVERERLGDLDELLLADAQAADAGVRVELDAEAVEEAPGGGGHGARGRGRGRRGSGSRPRKMLAATLSSGTRFSSWWMMAMPARSASRTVARRTGVPSIRISPSSAGWTPERIFISVDLPAPFSPMRAWTSPARRSNDDAVERGDAGEALADGDGAEQRHGIFGAGHASGTLPSADRSLSRRVRQSTT